MSLEPINVVELLRRHRLRPDKSLGQNFLVDPAALDQVVEAAGVSAGDFVLEIGPGLGSLTRLLAIRARQVVAVEIDKSLLPPLREVIAPFSNVRVVAGDILGLNPVDLLADGMQPTGSPQIGTGPQAGYLVVANIPYYITSALLRHLLEAPLRPERMVLTVQHEVAQRLSAEPGDLSLLALSVQVYGAPQVMAHIPAEAFYPAPKVDSAVVRVDLYPEPRVPFERLPAFFRLAKAGFSQKRKKLRNSLSAGMAMPAPEAEQLLQSAGIDPNRRAETVSLDEWKQLTEVYTAQKG